MPLVRICAGGDQQWSSLPRPRNFAMTGLAVCCTCVRENSSLSPHLPNRPFPTQAARQRDGAQTRQGRSRRNQNQDGTEEGSHGLQHSRIRRTAYTYALVERRLSRESAPARKCNEFRFRLAVERILENFREPCLSFGDPPRVMLTHRFLVIAEKVCYVRNRDPAVEAGLSRRYAGTCAALAFPQTRRPAQTP